MSSDRFESTAAVASAIPFSPSLSPSPSPRLSSTLPPPPWTSAGQQKRLDESNRTRGGSSSGSADSHQLDDEEIGSTSLDGSAGRLMTSGHRRFERWNRSYGGSHRRRGYGDGDNDDSGDGGSVRSSVLVLLRGITAAGQHAVAYFVRLQPFQRALVVVAAAASVTLGVLALVYSHRIFAALGPIAKGWRDLRGGWLIVWMMIFATGFPPIIGYSTACTMAGIVYGFPLGWPLAASASVVGSLAAFLASRGVLSRYVDRLVGSDARFMALSQVLRRDGLWVLAAVRFCPLPYSLSNGFLATIPSITPLAFSLSTAMASPKLLVHVFIGSRLAKLAEDGGSMSKGAKFINYISMLIFGMVGVGVGLFIFRRTMARAAEIAREEAEEEGNADVGIYAVGPDGRSYVDQAGSREDDQLLNPANTDVAALMDDDDISLWTADHFADGDDSGENSFINSSGNSKHAPFH